MAVQKGIHSGKGGTAKIARTQLLKFTVSDH